MNSIQLNNFLHRKGKIESLYKVSLRKKAPFSPCCKQTGNVNVNVKVRSLEFSAKQMKSQINLIGTGRK